jgi:hypothetical protein
VADRVGERRYGDDSRGKVPGMSQEPEETLEVLRAVWTAQGQTSTDLDEAHGHKKSCKNMAHVGFDGLAGEDGDLRAAWRAQLEREGKLNPEATSILGPTEPRR